MRTKTARQLQAENTKAHILLVAKELLQHQVFDDISIADICKKAGVSVGAFYHHFENKAGIIVELYKDVDEFFTRRVVPSVIGEEPADAIVDYLVEQCRYALNLGKDLVKNVYKAQIDNGNDFFLSADRGLPKGLLSMIERAQSANLLKSGTDARLLEKELLIVSRGIIYHWCVSDGSADILEHTRRIAKNYLKAYLA